MYRPDRARVRKALRQGWQSWLVLAIAIGGCKGVVHDDPQAGTQAGGGAGISAGTAGAPIAGPATSAAAATQPPTGVGDAMRGGEMPDASVGATSDADAGAGADAAAPIDGGAGIPTDAGTDARASQDSGVDAGSVANPTPDACPDDPDKVAPGVCGCGLADTDEDADGTADCQEPCPSDPNKTMAGACGCGTPDTHSDGDHTADCNDACPNDAAKSEAGACGCGVPDDDDDGDGTANCNDSCPNDASKTEPQICGCGKPDTDSDGDGTANCNDGCPNDASKTAPGSCGCGAADADSDGDGLLDCDEACPNDPDKQGPGECGCGTADVDADGDGTADCQDVPNLAYCDDVRDWDPLWRQYEQEVLLLVNHERAMGADCDTEGSFDPAGPLSMNDALRCAARVHSRDMGLRDYFDHYTPEGVGPGMRISNAGYAPRTWGENIAWGYAGPAEVVAGWMGSDGHCANIMNPSFTEIGVGYYSAGGNDRLWTQAFGRQ